MPRMVTALPSGVKCSGSVLPAMSVFEWLIEMPGMRCSTSVTERSGSLPMSEATIESTTWSEFFLMFWADLRAARWPVTTTTVLLSVAAAGAAVWAWTGADMTIMPSATIEAPLINAVEFRVCLEFFTLLSLSKKRRPKHGRRQILTLGKESLRGDLQRI